MSLESLRKSDLIHVCVLNNFLSADIREGLENSGERKMTICNQKKFFSFSDGVKQMIQNHVLLDDDDVDLLGVGSETRPDRGEAGQG